MSKIEWTDKSWNPVTGCTKVSVGCANCYAETMAKRLKAMGSPGYEHGFKVTLHPDRLDQPLHWRKPFRVFVCSMGDLFHEDVPTDFLKRVFVTIQACPQHTFQILTKRAVRLCNTYKPPMGGPPNVWIGVTAENQEQADKRIPLLLDVPAAIRFVSVEPCLSAVDLDGVEDTWAASVWLDWVIVGCESGPHRRECRIEWVRDLVEQCHATGVPVFVKQLSINGRVSKNPAEWPGALRVRDYPKVTREAISAEAAKEA